MSPQSTMGGDDEPVGVMDMLLSIVRILIILTMDTLVRSL